MHEDAAAHEPEADIHGSPDATLGGYFREHNRPPAFEGSDGEPYTVSLEAEKTPDLRAPWEGYLVFPRWAHTGLGVVGHVESGTLVRGTSREDVFRQMGQLSLAEIKRILDGCIDPADPTEPAEPTDPADPTAAAGP